MQKWSKQLEESVQSSRMKTARSTDPLPRVSFFSVGESWREFEIATMVLSISRVERTASVDASIWIRRPTTRRNVKRSQFPAARSRTYNFPRGRKRAKKEFEGSSVFPSDRLPLASQYFSNFLSRSYGTRSIMTSRGTKLSSRPLFTFPSTALARPHTTLHTPSTPLGYPFCLLLSLLVLHYSLSLSLCLSCSLWAVWSYCSLASSSPRFSRTSNGRRWGK